MQPTLTVEAIRQHKTADGITVVLGRLDHPQGNMKYCVILYRNGPAGQGYLNVTNYYKTRKEAEVSYSAN